MSISTRSGPPISASNTVLLGVLLLASAITAIAGRWYEAALLGVVAVAVSAMALYARRPNSRDVTRVNAIGYRDERDKHIAQVGFSVVGIVALILSAVEFAAITVLTPGRDWPPSLQTVAAAQLVLLCIVWGVANSIAAKRW